VSDIEGGDMDDILKEIFKNLSTAHAREMEFNFELVHLQNRAAEVLII
jgi:hypothetical protein